MFKKENKIFAKKTRKKKYLDQENKKEKRSWSRKQERKNILTKKTRKKKDLDQENKKEHKILTKKTRKNTRS